MPVRASRPSRPRKSTLGNLAVLGTGEFVGRGLTFLAFTHIARVLDTSDFGLLGSTLALIMFGTILVDQGMGVLGTREIARDPSGVEKLVGRIVSLQLRLSAIVVTLLLAATWVLPLDPTLALLLRGFAVSLFGIPFLLNWVFQGRNEMLLYAAPTALRQACFLVVAVVIVREPNDVFFLPVAEVAAVGVATLCFLGAYWSRGFRVRPYLRSGVDRELLRDGLPIGGSHLIWALRMYLPILVVLSAIGPDAAGLFESSHRIVMVYQALLGVYFTNLFPEMSAAFQSSAQSLSRLLRRSQPLSLGGAIALAVLTYPLVPSMIEIIFGEKYATPENVSTLVVLTWLIPVLAWRRTCRSALIVLNLQGREFYCSVAGIGLLIAMLVPMTREWGIVGSAWAMVVSEFLTAALTWLILRPRLRELVEGELLQARPLQAGPR